MTRALLLCAGDATRWDGYLGLRKQLVVIDGEPLLQRTVRQLRAAGVHDVRIVTKPGEQAAFHTAGAITVAADCDPARFQADRFTSSRVHWSTTERTLLLYGDVWFSDAAIAAIAGDTERTWRTYGRPWPSQVTGAGHGELFAWSWYPEQHGLIDTHVSRLIALQTRKVIDRSLGWELWRSLSGVPPRRLRLHVAEANDHLLVIDDFTDDFDKPKRYDAWMARWSRRGRAARVSVLVPFYTDQGPRAAAWAWLQRWWAAHFPDWELCYGVGDVAAWAKPRAVNQLAAQATGDLYVIADADVLLPAAALREAVERMQVADWVIPHRVVYRLTQDATTDLLGTDPATEPVPDQTRVIRQPYVGLEGGGCVVVTREAFRAVRGFDERFEGWGGEDASFARALTVMVAKPVRLKHPLWHCWHEPGRRANDPHYSQNARLAKRYVQAADVARMRTLLEERGPAPWDPVTLTELVDQLHAEAPA